MKKQSRINALTCLALAVMLAVSVVLPSFSASAKSSGLRIGSSVYFGSYEQDGNYSNGDEPIEWIVADVDGDLVMLVSRYILDTMPINEEWKKSQWKDSMVREWLNDDFLNDAFDDDEIDCIATTNVDNSQDRHTKAKGEKNTQDQVFLLSRSEVNSIFKSTSKMKCEATDYAIEQGLSVSRNKGNYYWWWTRTGGASQTYNVFVSSRGEFDYSGYRGYLGGGGIRPAIWVEKNAIS